MATNSLADLFHDTLRDVYWAEKHLLKVLPKMAKAAETQDLAKALLAHREETEGQVERLEKVFEMIDKTARAKTCDAMVGLSEEGNEIVEETDQGPVRDAGIIATAQAVEHYEIARYGTLIAWAKQLGYKDAVGLLTETLSQEKAADEKLSKLASAVNPSADQGKKAA